VVVRGGWAGSLAVVIAWCGSAGAAAPRALRAIELRPASDGTTVVIELTRHTAPRFAVVHGEDGELRRIHVDLPDGTAIAPGAAPSGTTELPVTRVRVGVVEPDHPRIVIEVDGATDYRVEKSDDPSSIVLTVIGATALHQPPTTAAPTTVEHPPSAPSASAVRRIRGRPKIVLDPGHGGDDPGAEGYAIEKQMTLDIARRLARVLHDRLRADVVLTRDTDQTLALKERTARANAEGADLFVSIHANANPTGRLRGIETYYLDNSTDRGTLRLAKLENGLDLLRVQNGEASLRYILSDLVQVGKLDDSVRLARNVQRGLVGHLRRRYPGIVDLGVKRGPFYVLVGAYMPCVLVETAFLSHPVEGRRLAREAYRADVAEGLYTGIARFLRELSRRRTL
jgi:N-acetylmuramoyl-L-alanine amidase